MKSLWNTNNNPLNTNEEKAEGLIGDHFVWNEEGRLIEEEEQDGGNEEVEENSLEDMIAKVEMVLSSTQNSSDPGLDSISYRFIKSIKRTILGKRLLEEVARNLIKGIIPRE